MTDPADVLRRSRTIAVVGASGTPGKAAWEVPQRLLADGWQVVPVNPAYDQLYGLPCHPDLAAATEANGGPLDLVDVFRPPAAAARVAADAVAVGARAVWLQLGIRSAEARRVVEAAGIDYVEDACTAVVAGYPGVRPSS
ncbi:MAG TPA: CoA-binding protein [Acidimicrobiales bacterium]|nr:CoA-binding protein [Acidimicrobiales bacterium]